MNSSYPHLVKDGIERMWWLLLLSCIVHTTTCTACMTVRELSKEHGGENRTIIGVEFGRSYVRAAVIRNTSVELIPLDNGKTGMPSCVTFTTDGHHLIGEDAKKQTYSNSQNTICNIRDLLGHNWNDTNVQKEIKHLSYKVVGIDNKPHVQVLVNSEAKTLSPEAISAMVLNRVKEAAEAYLSETVTDIVMSVPAYFNDNQRMACKRAVEMANMTSMRMINEPSSVLYGYELEKVGGERNIVIMHLDGNLLDVSFLITDEGITEIVSTEDKINLDDKQLDGVTMEHFVNVFTQKTGFDINKSDSILQQLWKELRKAVETRDGNDKEIKISLEGKEFSETISDGDLRKLTYKSISKVVLLSIQRLLTDGALQQTDQVHNVIVDGLSRFLPHMQQFVRDNFPDKAPLLTIAPEEVVIYGLAKVAAVLSREDSDDLILCDINPLTYGIETAGGYMQDFIKRNTFIPCRKTDTFSTAADDMTAVTIKIFYGQRAMTKDNFFLGSFNLTGIKPAPKGVPQIQVALELDVNNHLRVSAQDQESGRTNGIVIHSEYTAVSPEDTEEMIINSEKFADYDANKLKHRPTPSNLLEYTGHKKDTAASSVSVLNDNNEDETATIKSVQTNANEQDMSSESKSTTENTNTHDKHDHIKEYQSDRDSEQDHDDL